MNKGLAIRCVAIATMLALLLGMSGCSEAAELRDEMGTILKSELAPSETDDLKAESTMSALPIEAHTLEQIPEPTIESTAEPTIVPVTETTPTPTVEPIVTMMAEPTPIPAPELSKGYIDAKSLNMRAEPNKKSDIIQEYEGGQVVEITGEDGDWYKVAVAGKTGYMLKEYVAMGSAAEQKETPVKETEYLKVDAVKGYVDAGSLNMRAKPSKSSDIVKEYEGGQIVEIIGENGDWYKVAVAGATGYMLKEYVGKGTATSRAEATVTRTKTEEKQIVNLTIKPTEELEETKPTAKPAETPVAITRTTETPVPLDVSGDCAYIGNAKSKKFHNPTCRTLPDPENRVCLSSREQAVQEGYAPCGNCDP